MKKTILWVSFVGFLFSIALASGAFCGDFTNTEQAYRFLIGVACVIVFGVLFVLSGKNMED